MNDTSAQMTVKMREMVLRKSPADRLRMGCSMYDFSKQLVTNAILRENPDLSENMLRRELFMRFYGNDFNVVRREKILNYLVERALLPKVRL